MSWGHFPFVVLSFLSLVELLRDMISNLDNAFQTGNYPIIISTAKRILFDKIAFVVYITTLLIHIIPGYAYLASIKTRLSILYLSRTVTKDQNWPFAPECPILYFFVCVSVFVAIVNYQPCHLTFTSCFSRWWCQEATEQRSAAKLWSHAWPAQK